MFNSFLYVYQRVRNNGGYMRKVRWKAWNLWISRVEIYKLRTGAGLGNWESWEFLTPKMGNKPMEQPGAEKWEKWDEEFESKNPESWHLCYVICGYVWKNEEDPRFMTTLRGKLDYKPSNLVVPLLSDKPRLGWVFFFLGVPNKDLC